MKFSEMIHYQVITYALLMLGAFIGSELFFALLATLGLLTSFLFIIGLIIAYKVILSGSSRNMMNYMAIGFMYGVLANLIGYQLPFAHLLLFSSIGIGLTSFVFVLVKLKIKCQPLYFSIVLFTLFYIVYLVFNNYMINIAFGLMIFVIITPFFSLINIMNYVYYDKSNYFSKNPLMITLIPLFIFLIPKTVEVIVSEPLEIKIIREENV